MDGGKIFLADMPGFDGNASNLNDPLYDAISKRVDLILFVHSSVSAFNLTSASYLDKLREYNEAVPVYLVHNIFDSTYWKTPEERQSDIDRQVQKEYEEIRGKGFNIESEFISKVNLGKVTDAVLGKKAYLPDYEDDLMHELARFEEIEEKLYRKITSNISELRLKRCEDRTRGLRDTLVAAIDDEVVALQQKKNAKDLMAGFVDHLEKELSISMTEQDEIIGAVESSANRSVFRTISTTQVNKSASTDECILLLKGVLVQFLSDIDQKLTLNLLSKFRNKEEAFREMVAEKTGLRRIDVKITPAEAATAKNIYDDDVSSFMNKKFFEFLRDMWHGTHTVKDIKSYISKMENFFYGTKGVALDLPAERIAEKGNQTARSHLSEGNQGAVCRHTAHHHHRRADGFTGNARTTEDAAHQHPYLKIQNTMKRNLFLIATVFLSILFILLAGNVITIGEKIYELTGMKYIEYGFYLVILLLFVYVIIVPFAKLHHTPTFPKLQVSDDEELDEARQIDKLTKFSKKLSNNLYYLPEDERQQHKELSWPR